VPVDIGPGITAAAAAAAALGMPRTERGVSDTLVLTTGRAREGAALPDSTRHVTPGTTSAYYMSVGQAARIRDDLHAKGLPADTPVRVAMEVAKPGQKLIQTTLATLEADLAAEACTGCAVILITWPEEGQAVAQRDSRPDSQPDPARLTA